MTKQKNNIIPIELTQEEQEFDNILTDKLIEVAYNPSMRKDFIVQASDTEQYRFGHEVGWEDSEIAEYISKLLSQHFVHKVSFSRVHND